MTFRRGYSPSPETRAKMRAAALGRIHLPESREKMRQSKLGTKASPKARQKISASMRGAWAKGSYGQILRVDVPDHLKNYARKLRRNGIIGKDLIAALEAAKYSEFSTGVIQTPPANQVESTP